MTAKLDICLGCKHLEVTYRTGTKVLQRICSVDGERVKWPQTTCPHGVRRELQEDDHVKPADHEDAPGPEG